MRVNSLLILLLPTLVVGCVIMGDAFVLVTGEISEAKLVDGPSECNIHGVYAESKRVFSSRQVAGVFEADFAVPAGERDYFFEIECSDGGRYRSEVYTLGGKQDPVGRVIDLGKLDLRDE